MKIEAAVNIVWFMLEDIEEIRSSEKILQNSTQRLQANQRASKYCNKMFVKIMLNSGVFVVLLTGQMTITRFFSGSIPFIHPKRLHFSRTVPKSIP